MLPKPGPAGAKPEHPSTLAWKSRAALGVARRCKGEQFRDALWSAICIDGRQSYLTLDPNYLAFVLLWPMILCDRSNCRREHLHSAGGVCTRCRTILSDQRTQRAQIYKTKTTMPSKPSSARAAASCIVSNLTAQTDDQPERNGYSAISSSTQDAVRGGSSRSRILWTCLNVTTTMEVGVTSAACKP